MGFNPYGRIRRNRNTRAGDIAFITFFALVVLAGIVWVVLG